MAINLTKGTTINLNKSGIRISEGIVIPLSWDAPQPNNTGHDFDLDVYAFLLNSSGKLQKDSDFIFYNNLVNSQVDTAVKLSGDSRTGAKEGPDETIAIRFSNMPAYVESVAIYVSIFEAEERNQNFGAVPRVDVDLIVPGESDPAVSLDLDEGFPTATSVYVATLKRDGNDWSLTKEAKGIDISLNDLIAQYS